MNKSKYIIYNYSFLPDDSALSRSAVLIHQLADTNLKIGEWRGANFDDKISAEILQNKTCRTIVIKNSNR